MNLQYIMQLKEKELERVKNEKVKVMTIYKAQLSYMRNFKNMTSKEIAKITKTSKTNVNNWFSKDTIPRIPQMEILENLFFERAQQNIHYMRT